MLTFITDNSLALLVVVSAVLAYVAIWKLVAWNAHTPNVASSFAAIMTAVAIFFAGYWYLLERRLAPHADLTQVLTVVRADGRYALVESAVSIKNLGSTKLKVRRIDIRLQRATPTGFNLQEIENTGKNAWPLTFSDHKTPMYRGTELEWPIMKYYRGEVWNNVEPGETDVLTSTFIVPCSVEIVRVAAEVERITSEPWSRSWGVRTFANLTDACKGKGEKSA